jgi:redox-sensing transcriptional repressor
MSQSLPKPNDQSPEPSVPKAVVSRLSLYLRELQQIKRDVSPTTSSTELGNRLGFTNAQVRKDLAYFGQFGYPGIGYRCDELISAIKGILGTNHAWPIALVGLGNLGRALLGYRGFTHQGFHIVAVFDNDPHKIGSQVDGIPIYALGKLAEVVSQKGIRLAVLAVPATEAQSVADEIVAAGIEGILNFAPVTLSLPKQIHSVGVDLAIQLEQLSFSVVQGRMLGEESLPTEDSTPSLDDSSPE